MTEAIIRQGRTEIEVPYSEGSLVVAHPFYGPANARNLRSKIRGDNLVEPTTKEVAIFAESLFGDERKIGQELTRIMKNRYLRAFTGILYDPETKLASFVDYPEFDKRSIVGRDDLIKRVKAEESCSQVPFEHIKEGPIEWRNVAKHPILFLGVEKKELKNLQNSRQDIQKKKLI